MIGLPENNPNGDTTPGDIAGDALPATGKKPFLPRPGVLSFPVPCTGTNGSKLSLPGYGPIWEPGA